jgi:hypothetical protein
MNYQKLLAILYNLCLAEKTGSLFITVASNISATIVLQQGVITACFYCHEQGLVAVKNIKQFKLVNYVFTEKILFSLQLHHDLPATSQILYLLGYKLPENSPLLRRFENNKCYRGAMIIEELDKNPPVTHKSHTYRGSTY